MKMGGKRGLGRRTGGQIGSGWFWGLELTGVESFKVNRAEWYSLLFITRGLRETVKLLFRVDRRCLSYFCLLDDNSAAKTRGKSMSRTRNWRCYNTYWSLLLKCYRVFSPLSEDALTLLDAQDYISFFKSWGPNYVRSICRDQEITALIKFTSSS